VAHRQARPAARAPLFTDLLGCRFIFNQPLLEGKRSPIGRDHPLKKCRKQGEAVFRADEHLFVLQLKPTVDSLRVNRMRDVISAVHKGAAKVVELPKLLRLLLSIAAYMTEAQLSVLPSN
jgi:hypothetical protein